MKILNLHKKDISTWEMDKIQIQKLELDDDRLKIKIKELEIERLELNAKITNYYNGKVPEDLSHRIVNEIDKYINNSNKIIKEREKINEQYKKLPQ